MKRVLWIGLSLCFLSTSSAAPQKERTVYTVWDEFVHQINAGNEHGFAIQDYFQHCLKDSTSPETMYNIKLIQQLDQASHEFREAADKLDEMKRRIEYPIPKGVTTARK